MAGISYADFQTELNLRYIPFYEKVLHNQLRFWHPLGDKLLDKAKQEENQTYDIDIKVSESHGTRLFGLDDEVTAPLPSVSGVKTLTRSMFGAGTRIRFNRTKYMQKGNIEGRKAYIKEQVDSAMIGHKDQILAQLIRDTSTRAGLLFQVTAAATYTAGTWIPIADPADLPNLWTGTIVDVYQLGTSTKDQTQIVINAVDKENCQFTLDTAITVPAGGYDFYPQLSYGKGYSDSLLQMVTKNSAYMGLNPTALKTNLPWNPVEVDAAGASLSVDGHIVRLVEMLDDNGASNDLEMPVPRGQWDNLITDLKSNTYEISKTKLVGGYETMTIHVGKRTIRFYREPEWADNVSIPIFDMKEMELHYMGEGTIFVDKIGGGSAEGSAYVFKETAYQNTWAMDALSYLGLVTKVRCRNGRIKNLAP